MHDNNTPVPPPGTAESGTTTEPAVLAPAPVRYSVPEAARALGISERAVRKRIDAGALEAVKSGRAWSVLLPTITGTARPAVPAAPVTITTEPSTGTGPESAVPDAAPAVPDTVPAGVDLTPLVEAMERQSKEVQRLTEAATAWQFRAMRAEEQLKQLTAGETSPQPPAQAAPEPQHATIRAETAKDARPWWRRLLGLEE